MSIILRIRRAGRPDELKKIEAGRHILGGRPGLGVCIPDAGLAAQHAQVNVDPAGCAQVRSLQGSLRYEGREVKKTDKIEIKPGVFVEAGEVAISFEPESISSPPREVSPAPPAAATPPKAAEPRTRPAELPSNIKADRAGEKNAGLGGAWKGLGREDILALLAARDQFMPPLKEKLSRVRVLHDEAEKHQEEVSRIIAQLVREQPPPRGVEAAALKRVLEQEIVGLGVISALLEDPEVSEVMVNGTDRIYIERKGRIERTPLRYRNEAHLRTVIERIVSPLNKRIDDASPRVDARLADGSRVNAIIPPLAVDGPCVTIRKFKTGFGITDLLRVGAISNQMSDFLRCCVEHRKNVVVSGGTGSGKTTLLNALAAFIPEHERIVTIEDTAELRLPQEHVVRLESRQPTIEGTGAVPIRDLVINALRMRPDRIVVGECRGGEALDMMQAMNTGHDGSLTTLHANSPRDALRRLEVLCLMADNAPPHDAIREQIVSAIQVVVQVQRFGRDGSRRVVRVSEVSGMQGETPSLSDIYTFRQTGFDAQSGKVQGIHAPTGVVPGFIDEWRESGISVDMALFKTAGVS